jgi:hypothetical protein
MTHTTIDLDSTNDAAPRAARTGRMILSGLTGLVGLVLALGGIAAICAVLFARDGDGYYTADTTLQSGGYALATDTLNLNGPIPSDLLGTIRVRATADGAKPLFLGIAKTADVDRYLNGVERSEIDDYSDGGKATYTQLPGHAPRSRPADKPFWVAQSDGPGQRILDWNADSGNWTVVAMNRDAATGLALHADAGAKIGWLIWAGLGLSAIGFALVAGGVMIARKSRRPA